MAFEDFKTKPSVVIVYTGEGKGKTSASLGLAARALGTGWRVAYVQFIKHWDVGEHTFFKQIEPIFGEKLTLIKSGQGFFKADELSAAGVSEAEHRQAAQTAYNFALETVGNGKFDLVVCDEINNAVHDGLLTEKELETLIQSRTKTTSLCLTGRDFPTKLIPQADIVTEMTKVRHHFDDKFLANKGIDY